MVFLSHKNSRLWTLKLYRSNCWVGLFLCTCWNKEQCLKSSLYSTTLSIRTRLTVAYFRTGMRMSIENVSSTMMNVFGICIWEGEIQNILSQLSDSLGSEYSSSEFWCVIDGIYSGIYFSSTFCSGSTWCFPVNYWRP